MSWWGKLVGGAFGFMLGGPLGALLGVALGHNFDRGLKALPGEEPIASGDRERVQTAFFTAAFSVMGALAKAGEAYMAAWEAMDKESTKALDADFASMITKHRDIVADARRVRGALRRGSA